MRGSMWDLCGLVVLSMAWGGCKDDDTDDTGDETYKAGLVTDMGGIADAGFNANAWAGMQAAEDELEVQVDYLESSSTGAITSNIQQFADNGYDMVVTVGFMAAEPTEAAAPANPDVDFAIADWVPTTARDNLLGLTFQSDEGGFLAGVLAAGMTTSGTVATFGGMNIPPVTMFMVGFCGGVDYYNTQHSTSVACLGSDVFLNDFVNGDLGQAASESLIGSGADILFPVAGAAGLGALVAASNQGYTAVIGVDTDWYVGFPDYGSIILTSVLKQLDVAVLEAVTAGVEGTFEGGVWIGDLENGGTDIAPFHDFDADVPEALKTELETVRAGIIAGTISTGWSG